MSLANKVALVTGGTSGLGLAVATHLCRAGARVVLGARDAERGRDVEARLRAEGAEVRFVECDVSRAHHAEHLVHAAVGAFGRLDLAVNNASLPLERLAPLCELTEEDFDRTLAVDLKGVWLGMKFQIPQMLKAGGGAVVNVSSVNGLSGTPHAAAYCAAKHGVHGLSRTAAMEYGPRGVRVNVVAPGAHRTPMLEGVLSALSPQDPAAAEAQYAARIPLGRLGRPDEAAQAICWLLSDAASYVNGAVLTCDGGLTA